MKNKLQHLKRYSILIKQSTLDSVNSFEIRENNNGEYVLWSDIEKLLEVKSKSLQELRQEKLKRIAERKEWYAGSKGYKSIYDMSSLHIKATVVMIKKEKDNFIPYTDRLINNFLNELKRREDLHLVDKSESDQIDQQL